MGNVLTNSIVRGFGNTVGRRAANSMLDNRQTEVTNGPIKYSTFTIISGTILLGGFLGAIIGGIFFIFVSSQISLYVGLLLGMYLRNQDAIFIQLGLQIQKFIGSINYDINTSKLTKASNGRGALEINLQYLWSRKKENNLMHKKCLDYL
jgi:hypothetical protein